MSSSTLMPAARVPALSVSPAHKPSDARTRKTRKSKGGKKGEEETTMFV